MNNTITANELKTGGVSLIERVIGSEEEAVITVRGKRRYVVMPFEKYNRLRECELDTALEETRRDIAEGRFTTGDVDEHIKTLKQ